MGRPRLNGFGKQNIDLLSPTITQTINRERQTRAHAKEDMVG